MKDYNEIAKSVLERRDSYLASKKQQRTRFLRYGVPALCVCLVVGLCTLVLYHDGFPSLPGADSFSDVSGIQSATTSLPDQSSPSTSLPSGFVNQDESQDYSSGGQTASSPLSELSTVSVPQKQPTVSANESSVKDENSTVLQPSGSISEKPSSSPSPSIPVVSPSYDYATIDKFMSELDNIYQVEITPPGGSSVEPSMPDAIAPSTPMAPGAPGADVEVSAPVFDDNPKEDKDIWQEVAWLFEDGTFLLPDLGEGNRLMVLDNIIVNNDGLFYLYRFRDQNLQNKNGDLLVDIPSDSTAVQAEYEQLLAGGKYSQYTYKSIRFLVTEKDGITMIYWRQFGGYYKAYYVGGEAFLKDVLPELRLWYYYWIESWIEG